MQQDSYSTSLSRSGPTDWSAFCRWLVVLIGLFSILTPNLAKGAIWQFKSRESTEIRSQTPDEVAIPGTELTLRNQSGNQIYGLINVDPSSIPGGDTILQAELEIHVSSIDDSGKQLEIFAVEGPWDEGSATWTNSSGFINTTTPYASVDPSSVGVKTVDILPLVEGWHNLSIPPFGVAIAPEFNSLESKVYSSRYAQGTPRVRVVTDGPAPEIEYRVSVSNPSPDIGDTIQVTYVAELVSGPTVDEMLMQVWSPEQLDWLSDSSTTGQVTGSQLWIAQNLSIGVPESLTVDFKVLPAAFNKSVSVGFAYFGGSPLEETSENNTVGTAVQASGEPLRYKSFSYVGDDNPSRAFTGIGFTPRVVWIKSEGPDQAIIKTDTMTPGESKPMGNQELMQFNRIISLDSDGFTVGSDPDVNQSGETYHAMMLAGEAPYLETGTYVGDSAAGRTIPVPGVNPEWVMVYSEGLHWGNSIFASHDPGMSARHIGSGFQPDRLTGLGVESFTIGFRNEINETGRQHHYVAVDFPPGQGTTGFYVGNGNPRTITGLGFQPEFILIKSENASHQGTMRPDSMPGLNSLRIDNSMDTDLISSLNADGFSLGNRNGANANGDWHYYVALKDAEPIDFSISLSANRSRASVGDTVRFETIITNKLAGPSEATEVYFSLNPQADASVRRVSAGSYSTDFGIWSLPGLAAGAQDTLQLDGIIRSGFAGSKWFPVTMISSDADTSDNNAGVLINIEGSDLVLNLSTFLAPTKPGDPWEVDAILSNRGPSDEDSVAVDFLLGGGITLGGAIPSRGSHAADRWTVGFLEADSTASIRLQYSTAGAPDSVSLFGSVVDRLWADTNSGDESDSLTEFYDDGDLALRSELSPVAPALGDTVDFRLWLSNRGIRDADSVAVNIPTPAGLVYHSATPAVGSFAADLWEDLALASGDSTSLLVRYTIPTSMAGKPVQHQPGFAYRPWVDGVAGNDSSAISYTVRSADLDLQMSFTPSAAAVGDTVQLVVDLTNEGPSDLDSGQVGFAIPTGFSLLSYSPSSHTTVGDSVWAVDPLLAGSADQLSLQLLVQAQGGDIRTATASINSSRPGDPTLIDQNAQTSFTRISPGEQTIRVRSVELSPSGFLPGGATRELLQLVLRNDTAATDRLDSLAIALGGTWAGTPAQWLNGLASTSLSVSDMNGDPLGSWAGFASETEIRFPGLGLDLAPGDSLRLSFDVGAGLLARDGDKYQLTLNGPQDLFFQNSTPSDGGWPLQGDEVNVNGMSAAQLSLGSVAATSARVGESQIMVLNVVVPPNGYEADTLERVNLINRGSAQAGQDIAAVHLYADDGDGSFDGLIDTKLGIMADTGTRWELTGISLPIPIGGQRIFALVDIAEFATVGRSLDFALPSAADPGLGMASRNDGPRDQEVGSGAALTISAVDRITWTAQTVPVSTVNPGMKSLPLLKLRLENSYSESQTLLELEVTNAVQSPAGADPDGAFRRLRLRADANRNGELDDELTDPVLATAEFNGGLARFAGFSLDSPGDDGQTLFVVGDISLSGAADGDVLAVSLAGPSDALFAADLAQAGAWPLMTPAGIVVDGMVAAQLITNALPDQTVGPNDGPIAVLDLRIPPNGGVADLLERLDVEPTADATDSDLAGIRLWRDGGDGVFDAGAGDDGDLGPMVFFGGRWSTAGLSEAVPTSGLRLFVGATIAAAPADSSLLALQIPVDGIRMQSGNSGPLDFAVLGQGSLLLSQAPLLVSYTLSPITSVVGQTIALTMDVRNRSAEQIQGINPSALTFGGTATMAIAAGPSPASFDLAPGASNSFSWTLDPQTAGTFDLLGSASGIGMDAGLTRRSLSTRSGTGRVFLQATDLGVFPTPSMPATLSRGQTSVVPVQLTFTNPGGASASAVRLQRLTMRLEDAQGNGIVPANLLSRIIVAEGGTTYLDKTSLETSGSDVELALATPAIVTGEEPATISLRLDVLSTTTVPNFRIVFSDSTSLLANDATSGAPVQLQLQDGSWPVATSLGRIVVPAEQLDVSLPVSAARRASQGQLDVELLSLNLDNPGVIGLGSDVRLAALSFVLEDSLGQTLARPADVFREFTLSSSLESARLSASGLSDSVVSLELSPLVSVPAGSPLSIVIRGDLAEDAQPGAWRLRLLDAALWEAIDANTGQFVPVNYLDLPSRGALVEVQLPATNPVFSGTPRLPSSLGAGASDVTAMNIQILHEGGPESADLILDQMEIALLDQGRNPVAAAGLLRALELRAANGTTLDRAVGFGSGVSRIILASGGLRIAPGDSLEMEILLDLESIPPGGSLELVIDGADLVVRDANSLEVRTATGTGGAAALISSGLALISAPPTELQVVTAGLLPAIVGGGQGEIDALNLTFVNNAAAGSGEILVDYLRLRTADLDRQFLASGDALESASLFRADSLLVQIIPVAGDSTLTFNFSPALSFAPGVEEDFTLRVGAREGGYAGGLRLGILDSDIGVQQPTNPLLLIDINAGPGGELPFWTKASSAAEQGLEESWTNFPNPFAAGRESTTLSFNLPSAGDVTIRLHTMDGRLVHTLVDSEFRDAGLHQNDLWDGLNGNGDAVRNGAYLAEIQVQFEDGSNEQYFRKVAVKR